MLSGHRFQFLRVALGRAFALVLMLFGCMKTGGLLSAAEGSATVISVPPGFTQQTIPSRCGALA